MTTVLRRLAVTFGAAAAATVLAAWYRLGAPGCRSPRRQAKHLRGIDLPHLQRIRAGLDHRVDGRAARPQNRAHRTAARMDRHGEPGCGQDGNLGHLDSGSRGRCRPRPVPAFRSLRRAAAHPGLRRLPRRSDLQRRQGRHLGPAQHRGRTRTGIPAAGPGSGTRSHAATDTDTPTPPPRQPRTSTMPRPALIRRRAGWLRAGWDWA